MEGEVRCRPQLYARLLGAERLQVDVKGSFRRDAESADLCEMPQQLSMAQRSHWRWLLLS